MSELTVIKGPCTDCGAPVSREVPASGFGSGLLQRLPLICEECVARAEREEAAEAEQVRAARNARTRAERVRASGVPEHLWAFRFEDVELKPELEAACRLARRWGTGEVNGALLVGPVGVGKSRLAVAAANEMLMRRRVRFFSAPMILARLGSGDFGSAVREDVLTALTGTLPLIIDDLDKARPSPYAAEVMFLAVDTRADGAAPLMVTTNKRLSELAEQWPDPYGAAIASRLSLLEGARADGADRRRERTP